MLRGNHETSEVNSHYGFKEDCMVHYDLTMWDAFQVFQISFLDRLVRFAATFRTVLNVYRWLLLSDQKYYACMADCRRR